MKFYLFFILGLATPALGNQIRHIPCHLRIFAEAWYHPRSGGWVAPENLKEGDLFFDSAAGVIRFREGDEASGMAHGLTVNGAGYSSWRAEAASLGNVPLLGTQAIRERMSALQARVFPDARRLILFLKFTEVVSRLSERGSSHYRALLDRLFSVSGAGDLSVSSFVLEQWASSFLRSKASAEAFQELEEFLTALEFRTGEQLLRASVLTMVGATAEGRRHLTLPSLLGQEFLSTAFAKGALPPGAIEQELLFALVHWLWDAESLPQADFSLGTYYSLTDPNHASDEATQAMLQLRRGKKLEHLDPLLERLARPLCAAYSAILSRSRKERLRVVPMYTSESSFHLPRLVAEKLSGIFSIPVFPEALSRDLSPQLSRQVSYDSRWDRLFAAARVQVSADPRHVAGHTVILVDDVASTYATLTRARAELLKAGANRVYTLTLLASH